MAVTKKGKVALVGLYGGLLTLLLSSKSGTL